MQNEYKILGVNAKATPEEIKVRYRSLMMEAHPDKGGTTEAAAKLTMSYNTLMDRKARKLHDEALKLAGITPCGDCRGVGTRTIMKKTKPCATCGGTGWSG